MADFRNLLNSPTSLTSEVDASSEPMVETANGLATRELAEPSTPTEVPNGSQPFGQRLALAPANLAMSALMNSVDYGNKALLWATEKVTDAAGSLTGSDTLKNFDPYSYAKQTGKYDLTGREMSETVFGSDSTYASNEKLFDFGGDLVASSAIIGSGLKALSTTSKAATALTKAGVPAKWVDRVFINSEAVKNELKTISEVVNGTAAYGVNPSSVMSATSVIGKSVKRLLPTFVKESLYADAVLYASGYKRDQWYPEGFTSAMKYAPLNLALGTALPVVGHTFSAGRIFARGSKVASNELSNALNEQLIRDGLDPEWLKTYNENHNDLLNGFGLASNSEADAITANSYITKALETIKADKVQKASASKGGNVQEIIKGYDDAIMFAKANTDNAINSLVKTTRSSDKDFAKQAINKAIARYSNVMQGTKSVELGPVSQGGLDTVIATKQRKMKELANKLNSEDDILRHESLEKYQDLSEEGYQLIDADGSVYDGNDYHIRWRDDLANLEKVETASKPIEASGKGYDPKEQVFKAAVTDADFANKGRRYNLEAYSDGRVVDQPSKYVIDDVTGHKTKRPESMTKPQQLFYTDSAAYDTAWYLLGKQYDSMMTMVHTSGPKGVGARPMARWQMLATEAKPRPVNLATTDFLQMAYLSKLGKSIGDDNLTRLFKFDNINYWSERASKQLGKPANQLSLTDVLDARRYELTKEAMTIRRERGLANKDYRLDRYSEDSLLEEITGFTTRDANDSLFNNAVGADYWLTDSVADLQKRFADSDPLARPSRRYLLQKTSEIQSLTDTINNEVMARLAEEKLSRMDYLLGKPKVEGLKGSPDTLVSRVTRATVARPQYQSGYLASPTALTYGADVGLTLGSKILTQDFRHGADAAMNASVGLNHELTPIVNKEINSSLEGLVGKTKALLGDSESIDQLAKFTHQSNAGYKIADEGLVKLGDNRWAFKLDASEVNDNVAEHAKLFSKVDSSEALAQQAVPDPITGKPLIVNDKVADLIREQHSLNLMMHQGDEQLASAFGRTSGPFRNYHMPARNAQGKVVRVIGTTDGDRFNPQLYVFGATEKQADALAKLEATNMGITNNPKWSIKTSDDIHMDLEMIYDDIDNNFMHFADYNDVVQQQLSKGGQLSGVRTSVGSVIESGEGLLKRIIESNNSNLQRQAMRARKAVFYDQVNKAQVMLGNKEVGSQGYSTLNEYLANLIGGRYDSKDRLSSLYKAVDSILDLGGQAISDFKSLPEIAKAQQLAELKNGTVRQTARFFKNGDEVKLLNGMSREGLGTVALEQASRVLNGSAPKRAREIMGSFNRVATDALLMLGNLGYALMNLVSLPAVAPMVRSSMRRQAGERAYEYAARTGAWVKQVGNGENVAIDLVGGLSETLNSFQHNKKLDRAVVGEAFANGWLSGNAQLLNEVFMRPADSLLGKTGNQVVKAFRYLGEKSEEMSRILTFKMGYRLGQKSGLDHSSAMSFAKKFMDNCVGNYASSNRPAIFQQGIGGLFGLFYTYNHNIIQQYLGNYLRGDKLSLATGAAAQVAMFGTESIPGSESVKNILLPIGEGKDYYSALRDQGFDDTTARGIMYGAPSAVTGLDFSAKGTINAISVPGTVVPPVLSLGKDIAEASYETVKQLASTTGVSADTLWEIWQTRMPAPALKSAMTLAGGYKIDRNGNVLIDKDKVGKGLWYASNLLSMRTVDESMNREFNLRNQQYNAWKSERSRLHNNDLAASLRASDSDDQALDAVARYARNQIADGADPNTISGSLKAGFIKAFATKADSAKAQLANKQHHSAATANLLRSAVLQSTANSSPVSNNVNPPIVGDSEPDPVAPATQIGNQPTIMFDNDSGVFSY